MTKAGELLELYTSRNTYTFLDRGETYPHKQTYSKYKTCFARAIYSLKRQFPRDKTIAKFGTITLSMGGKDDPLCGKAWAYAVYQPIKPPALTILPNALILPDYQRDETVLHELAHCYVYMAHPIKTPIRCLLNNMGICQDGHDAEWQAVAKQFGIGHPSAALAPDVKPVGHPYSSFADHDDYNMVTPEEARVYIDNHGGAD